MPFGSETVIIPGKRPQGDSSPEVLANSGSSSGTSNFAAADMTPTERSKLWNRLFPAPDPDQTAATLDSLAQGLLIRNYIIEKRIGVGGMGAVFKSWDEDLERVVALKVLSPSYCRDPLAVKRFRNESRSAARLDHDNIARVYGIGESHGLHYIAFEYVDGINIRDLIRQQIRLNIPEALSYILQIVAALKHTAAAHVFHRDIKPSNIIVKPNGRAKLVDWGLARLNNRSEDSVDLTSAGTTLGTFDYISPEQARDPRTVDLRSDIYSLGCTFYHMVTGEAPYSSGTMLQKLLDHQNKTVPNPSLRNPSISPELASIIMRMMASDPARRYQDADTLLEDLYTVADQYNLRAIPAESVIFARPVEAQLEPFWKRHLGLISIVSLLLIAVFSVERFNAMVYTQGAVTQPDVDNPPISELTLSDQAVPSSGLNDSLLGQAAPRFLSDPMSPYNPANDLTEFLQKLSLAGKMPATPSDAKANEFFPSEQANLIDSKPSLSNPEKVIPDPGAAGFSPIEPGGMIGKTSEVPTATNSGSLSGVGDGFESLVTTKLPVPPGASEVIAASGLPAKTPDKKPGVPNSSSILPNPPVNAGSTESSSAKSVVYEVVRSNSSPVRYDSLKLAIQNVQQDQYIKILPLEGVSEVVITEPITVDKKYVIIKGEPSNPVHLIFRPTSLNASEELFLLANSSTLSLQGLNFTVDLNEKQTGPEMALCTVMDDSQLQLRNTTVTLKSGMYRRAVLANLTSDFRTMPSDVFSNRVRPSVSIESSAIRGAGTVVSTQRTHAAQVTVTKSGIAVQGAMIFSHIQGMSAPGGGALDVQLERSTIATTRGLFEAEQDPMAMDLLVSAIEANECIFLNLGEYPLITLSGNESTEALLDHFTWSGDRNFFDRYGIMMLISEVGTDDEGYDELSQADWQSHWRAVRSSYFDLVGWKNHDLVHTEPLTWKRTDFALHDFENLAMNLGAGVDITEIPSFYDETPAGRGEKGRLGFEPGFFGGIK